MKSKIIDDMYEFVKSKYPLIHICKINVLDLVFEERVIMNCFYCGKYKNNWKCPPNLPDINYIKMMSEFENCALVFIKYELNEDDYEEIRNFSAITLHRALLEMEKYLYNFNNSMAISFIGGGCRLCKNGCGINGCNNPYHSRSPIEATGINVIKTAEKYDIKINFPASDIMLRIGLLLW